MTDTRLEEVQLAALQGQERLKSSFVIFINDEAYDLFTKFSTDTLLDRGESPEKIDEFTAAYDSIREDITKAIEYCQSAVDSNDFAEASSFLGQAHTHLDRATFSHAVAFDLSVTL